MGLNENHQRALLSALSYADDLLTRAEAATGGARSPFSTIVPDLSPAELNFVVEQVATIRSRMAEALQELDIQLPRPSIKASWSIQTSLTFARITLANVTPSRLKGYGEMDDATAVEVERLEGDLDRSLQRLLVWLTRGAARDLRDRLERLSGVEFDLARLRTLEEIVTALGLVEFQGSLESIVERLEAGTTEIAFFGRVSSGKSSLLNLIVGAPILPVGITPVTAVPTRIEFGGNVGATISFTDAPDQEVPLERLSEFVSELGNPGNAKRVVRATVRVPSARLRPGLVLVDTPGVGALAAAGARESYYYLPRCDIGVVLVDVAGSISGEDVDLVRRLLESGIQPKVLASKADLVGEAERMVFCDYVRAELARGLSVEVSVFPVSARGPDAAMTVRWFERELAPVAEHARASVLVSAGRKLEAVREGVTAVLRAASGIPVGTGDGETEARLADDVARDAESLIRATHARLNRLVDDARTIATLAIARSASEMARRCGDPSLRLGALIHESLTAAAREVRTQICDELTSVRDRLGALVSELRPGRDRQPQLAEKFSVDLVALPEVLVPASLDALEVHAPWWLRRFRGPLERRLGENVRAYAGESMEDAARVFANGVREWSRRAVERLAEQVAAYVEPLRAAGRSRVDNAAVACAALRRLEKDAQGGASDFR